MTNNTNFEKVLVLSPHPDDAELAAGGTIARFIGEGKNVYIIVFSLCETSIPEGFPPDSSRVEFDHSTRILGILPDRITLLNYPVRTFPDHRQEILQDMINLGERIKPDLVLAPSSNDTHQDHSTIYNEAVRAFKKTSSIWGYEHPWNNLTFTTHILVKLEEHHLQKKIEALKHYQSQINRTYMEERYEWALASVRGQQADFRYAEAFELVRLLV